MGPTPWSAAAAAGSQFPCPCSISAGPAKPPSFRSWVGRGTAKRLGGGHRYHSRAGHKLLTARTKCSLSRTTCPFLGMPGRQRRPEANAEEPIALPESTRCKLPEARYPLHQRLTSDLIRRQPPKCGCTSITWFLHSTASAWLVNSFASSRCSVSENLEPKMLLHVLR